MKSLEARKAYRQKQRDNEQKEREQGGLPKEQWAEDGGGTVASNATDEGNREETDEDETGTETTPMTAEEAEDWVNDSVENIKANLDQLSDADLTAIEEAEKRGKARVSVSDAVAKEREARKAKSGDWSPGK